MILVASHLPINVQDEARRQNFDSSRAKGGHRTHLPCSEGVTVDNVHIAASPKGVTVGMDLHEVDAGPKDAFASSTEGAVVLGIEIWMENLQARLQPGEAKGAGVNTLESG